MHHHSWFYEKWSSSWWFQPIWKIFVKMGSSSPIFGVKTKNRWNHHPVIHYRRPWLVTRPNPCLKLTVITPDNWWLEDNHRLPLGMAHLVRPNEHPRNPGRRLSMSHPGCLIGILDPYFMLWKLSPHNWVVNFIPNKSHEHPRAVFVFVAQMAPASAILNAMSGWPPLNLSASTGNMASGHRRSARVERPFPLVARNGQINQLAGFHI